MPSPKTKEGIRLEEDFKRQKNWKRWGPYLSERQWGTVREDYSEDADSWKYFTHDQARSRAYRWGEDGLLGITDRECRLCFAVALWNYKDPILKERLYGLTNAEGNHGEDVKEVYFYQDNTPTHTYSKALYRYPHAEYPYTKLKEENQKRGLKDGEYEILDTGVFDENRFFDVEAEYIKEGPNDILIQLSVTNHGPETAKIIMMPNLWFRNTWSWGYQHEGATGKPRMEKISETLIETEHETLGKFYLEADCQSVPDEILFTDNETNKEKLFGVPNNTSYVKDGFHEYVIHENKNAVSLEKGTKAGLLYQFKIPSKKKKVIRLRLYCENEKPKESFGKSFEKTLQKRKEEADNFYAVKIPNQLPEEEKNIMREAYAGLLWTKQFYHYSVRDWLEGDPNEPEPPKSRWSGKNNDWQHLFNRDIISMPDKWEYPWYAAWDLAFHMLPFSRIDPEFAKEQLILMLREWYMHPNGQLPAYEYNFEDVNPPVHAWACWRVYKISAKDKEHRDLAFLERAFQKLLLNFTWWVNRKDPQGHNLFSGGFLGLDNIGVFDRSKPLPDGAYVAQADGTGWMAFYCSTMLSIALELAAHNSAYEDIASKFFEHFVAIVDAMNEFGGNGLWNEKDGFYYSLLIHNNHSVPLKVRSMVGLLPMIAVEVLDQNVLEKLPGFKKRMDWFLEHRKDLSRHISCMEVCQHKDHKERLLLAIPSKERLEKLLGYLLNQEEFLSEYGIRSMSKYYGKHPYIFEGKYKDAHKVQYVPGESDSRMFGGNSNWRGPIWFPTNYLLIEALERYYHFYGDSLRIEFPTGSGKKLNLNDIAHKLAKRLARIFLSDKDGKRPFQGQDARYPDDLLWKNPMLFHEYFHGDTGKGLGANHQTGWTALITRILEDPFYNP